MAAFDYGIIVIGSGFGGSVAAFRAAEKGYRVGVMESGKRWNDEDIPKVNWNGSRFDITTGVILSGPAAEPLNVYEVKEADGDIQPRI
jgi:cholesterol oxidase